MLKQQLAQKLTQRLSPQQIQVVKMIGETTLELEERIRQELEDNPALEEGIEQTEEQELVEDSSYEEAKNNDDFDPEEYMIDDDIPDYKLKINNASKDDRREDIPFSAGMTLHEYLVEQIGLFTLTKNERMIFEYVIGTIDEEGYLRRKPRVIMEDILIQTGLEINYKEMNKVLTLLQQLDPAGIGAYDLQECLLFQLERKEQTEAVELAKTTLINFFEFFINRRYDKIQENLEIDDEQMKMVINEIIRLNPKPGKAWSGDLLEKSMDTIIPDFILENDEGELSVHLNNTHIPELRVNSSYNDMFSDYAGNKENQKGEMKEAVMFIKQKIDSARWFIEALRQRHDTLLKTMLAIIDFQKEFFLEGDESYLKPMILKDIANKTGYDVSTISRVSNSKYIQTDFGIFSLKYFFSESRVNESGSKISIREIKQILQDCINREDKKNPVTDEQICEVLRSKGCTLARRTIAKYREQLNIPSARIRKIT